MRIYKTRADFDKLQSEGSSSLVAGTVCTITDEPTNPMYVYQGGVWNSTVTATTNHVTGGIELSAGEGVKIGELSPTARSSRTVIVDTDFWTDCDDVGALRICTYAEKMGIWDVAAYLLNTTYIDNPGALDRVMYYDGRKTNLIAVPKTSHVPAGSPPYQATMVNQQRRVGYATNCPDAVTAARTVLAAAGTWAADVAITAFSSVPVPLILGAQVAGGGTEPFVGWINEIRIYAETHDDTQSAAVITEMSA